jgi:hypothetical protein
MIRYFSSNDKKNAMKIIVSMYSQVAAAVA